MNKRGLAVMVAALLAVATAAQAQKVGSGAGGGAAVGSGTKPGVGSLTGTTGTPNTTGSENIQAPGDNTGSGATANDSGRIGAAGIAGCPVPSSGTPATQCE
jgi:hypothetical protein